MMTPSSPIIPSYMSRAAITSSVTSFSVVRGMVPPVCWEDGPLWGRSSEDALPTKVGLVAAAGDLALDAREPAEAGEGPERLLDAVSLLRSELVEPQDQVDAVSLLLAAHVTRSPGSEANGHTCWPLSTMRTRSPSNCWVRFASPMAVVHPKMGAE